MTEKDLEIQNLRREVEWLKKRIELAERTLEPVVRCKDCKYFLPPTKHNFTACCYVRSGGMLAPKPNDFCSYGERITNDG